MARLKGISASIKLLEEHLTGEPRRQRLIKLARDSINAAAMHNRQVLGREPDYVVAVDGRKPAPIESVKLGGIIVAQFTVANPAADFTWETLVRLSPVDSNPKTRDEIVYRDRHRILVNGAEIRATPGQPLNVTSDDVVTFVNLLPYARKIEGGPGRTPQSDQAPDGVYEATSEIVRARFGNVINVKFTYGTFLGAEAGKENRYPFIELSPKRRR